MRIITGSLKGRYFETAKSPQTHPMSEKIRGALFNMLGDIENLSILDAFSGSGGIALEAASRGCASIVAIEIDFKAQKVIEQNINDLNLKESIRLVKSSVQAWLKTSKDYFDIVILDPPYNDVDEMLLQRLAERVKSAGLVVVSLPTDSSYKLPDSYLVVRSKKYGDAQLIIYRQQS